MSNKKNSGFSLIEVLIAVFLIGVAFVGVVAFFNSSLQSNFDAKSELIAAGLAQEGSELIRNLRDYHALNETTWTELVAILPGCEKIDFESLEDHTCGDSSVDENVCINDEGRYKQCEAGETKTEMKRTIEISPKNDGDVDYLNVVCTVTWNDRTTVATDRLYENEY